MRSLVALGAGFAGVLLYLVSAKGVPGSVLVTYFTPLPIMIAALGWGQSLGLAGAAAGTIVLAIVVDPAPALHYALDFALPGWLLAYLALLARTDVTTPAGTTPAGTTPAGTATPLTQWYPLGKIVLWAVAAAALATLTGSLVLGAGSGLVEQQMRAAAGRLATLAHSAIGSNKPPSDTEIATLATTMVRILPIAGVVSFATLYLANLWIAGRIVQLSHRLARPWPNVPENLRLPRFTAALFGVALLLASALPGIVGLAARMVAAGVGFVLMLQALAVAHALSRPVRGRGAILAAFYVAIFALIPFSLVALVALGLTDLFVPLRDRKLRPRPPDHRSSEDKGDDPWM